MVYFNSFEVHTKKKKTNRNKTKGPFLPEQENGLKKNEDDHCLPHKCSSAVFMPVWDPYRYLALLLMHTKMQTHSNTLFIKKKKKKPL